MLFETVVGRFFWIKNDSLFFNVKSLLPLENSDTISVEQISFLVKDGILYTPEGRNILRGISRSYVIEIAKGMGIEVREQNLEPYDLYCADEAFLTGTPFCMLPVTSLNGLKIGDGNRGKIFNKILLFKSIIFILK